MAHLVSGNGAEWESFAVQLRLGGACGQRCRALTVYPSQAIAVGSDGGIRIGALRMGSLFDHRVVSRDYPSRSVAAAVVVAGVVGGVRVWCEVGGWRRRVRGMVGGAMGCGLVVVGSRELLRGQRGCGRRVVTRRRSRRGKLVMPSALLLLLNWWEVRVHRAWLVVCVHVCCRGRVGGTTTTSSGTGSGTGGVLVVLGLS